MEPNFAIWDEATDMFDHYMSYNSHGSKGPGVYCTCGKSKAHPRGKPLLLWAKKHMAKTGHKWRKQG